MPDTEASEAALLFLWQFECTIGEHVGDFRRSVVSWGGQLRHVGVPWCFSEMVHNLASGGPTKPLPSQSVDKVSSSRSQQLFAHKPLNLFSGVDVLSVSGPQAPVIRDSVADGYAQTHGSRQIGEVQELETFIACVSLLFEMLTGESEVLDVPRGSSTIPALGNLL